MRYGPLVSLEVSEKSPPRLCASVMIFSRRLAFLLCKDFIRHPHRFHGWLHIVYAHNVCSLEHGRGDCRQGAVEPLSDRGVLAVTCQCSADERFTRSTG